MLLNLHLVTEKWNLGQAHGSLTLKKWCLHGANYIILWK